MLNETVVTVQGWLGNNVTLRRAGNGQVASFRLAATPRRFNPQTGEWSDDTTQWFTVNAWRALGEHCAASLRRSDPVVVVGRLRAQSWTNSAGVEMTSYEIDAQSVGHDLNRGSSTFTRAQRAAPAPPSSPSATPASDHAPDPGREEGRGEGSGEHERPVGQDAA